MNHGSSSSNNSERNNVKKKKNSFYVIAGMSVQVCDGINNDCINNKGAAAGVCTSSECTCEEGGGKCAAALKLHPGMLYWSCLQPGAGEKESLSSWRRRR